MNAEHTLNWSDVAVDEINKPETKNQQGVKIQFMLSPTDIPTAYRAYNKDGMLYVEFKYLGTHESTRVLQERDGLSLDVGKNSRRIYKITVDPRSLLKTGEDVEIEIKFAISAENALKAMKKAGSLNSGNADAIRRFLEPATAGKEQLFSQLSFGH